MKNLSVKYAVPSIFVMKNNKTMVVPSMVLSTVLSCFLIAFIPQLMTLWMQLASTPPAN